MRSNCILLYADQTTSVKVETRLSFMCLHRSLSVTLLICHAGESFVLVSASVLPSGLAATALPQAFIAPRLLTSGAGFAQSPASSFLPSNCSFLKWLYGQAMMKKDKIKLPWRHGGNKWMKHLTYATQTPSGQTDLPPTRMIDSGKGSGDPECSPRQDLLYT